MTLEQSEKERRTAQGNVRALSVVIGLMADNYPDKLACQYIRECVELGLIGDLVKKENSALKHLAQIMDGKTYEKLVEMLSEPEEPEEEQAFEMPDASQAKRESDEAEKVSKVKSGAKAGKTKTATRSKTAKGEQAADGQ